MDTTTAQLPAQLPLNGYRTQLIQRAARNLPVTAEGLPVGYYRTDLLPQRPPQSAQEEIDALRSAYVDLNFIHGYPTLPDGRPFWHKLDFEAAFAYGAFQVFLDTIDDGPRAVDALAQNQELLQIARQIYAPGQSQNEFGPAELNKILQEVAITNYWRPRSKAYDLYKDAAHRHVRLRRQIRVEDEHFVLAQNLLAQLKAKVLDSPDFFEKLEPKVALDMLNKLVGIMRVSAGLPSTGPLSQKETPEETTFEMILRRLGRETSLSGALDGGHGGLGMGPDSPLSRVLDDPHTTGMLQEVVLKVTRATQIRNDPDDPVAGEGYTSRRGPGRRRRAEEEISIEDVEPYDLTGAPGVNK